MSTRTVYVYPDIKLYLLNLDRYYDAFPGITEGIYTTAPINLPPNDTAAPVNYKFEVYANGQAAGIFFDVIVMDKESSVIYREPKTIVANPRQLSHLGGVVTLVIDFNDDATGADVPVSSIILNKGHLSVVLGETETLIAVVEPPHATNKNIIWESTNPSVATVTDDGLIETISVGSTMISARSEEGYHSASAQLDVVDVAIPVSAVTINLTSSKLEVGKQLHLTGTVIPSNATNQSIEWTTSNSSVVTVLDGIVTAHTPGVATITMKSVDGGFELDCIITSIGVNSLSIRTQPTLFYNEGHVLNLTPLEIRKLYTDGEFKYILFHEFYENNLIVDKVNGMILEEKDNQMMITITDTVSGKTVKTAPVTVDSSRIPVVGLSLNLTEFDLTIGDAGTITPIVSPSNATDRSIEWYSSNTDIASVEDGIVTGKNSGSVVISAKTVDGAFSAICLVRVDPVFIPVEGLRLSKEKTTIMPNKTEYLTADIINNNATDKSIIWSSSDDNICTVSQTGLIRGITADKTAIIKATTVDRNFVKSCLVTVTDTVIQPISLTTNQRDIEIELDQSETIIVEIHPENSSNQLLIWTSDTPPIATVDVYGRITARTIGSATINVSTSDNNVTIPIKVKVTSKASPKIDVNGVAITKDYKSLIAVHDSLQLTATVYPINATNRNVTWSTSDPLILQVDKNGLVSGIGSGTATIIVRTIDKQLEDRINITVSAAEDIDAPNFLIPGLHIIDFWINDPAHFTKQPTDINSYVSERGDIFISVIYEESHLNHGVHHFNTKLSRFDHILKDNGLHHFYETATGDLLSYNGKELYWYDPVFNTMTKIANNLSETKFIDFNERSFIISSDKILEFDPIRKVSTTILNPFAYEIADEFDKIITDGVFFHGGLLIIPICLSGHTIYMTLNIDGWGFEFNWSMNPKKDENVISIWIDDSDNIYFNFDESGLIIFNVSHGVSWSLTDPLNITTFTETFDGTIYFSSDTPGRDGIYRVIKDDKDKRAERVMTGPQWRYFFCTTNNTVLCSTRGANHGEEQQYGICIIPQGQDGEIIYDKGFNFEYWYEDPMGNIYFSSSDDNLLENRGIFHLNETSNITQVYDKEYGWKHWAFRDGHTIAATDRPVGGIVTTDPTTFIKDSTLHEAYSGRVFDEITFFSSDPYNFDWPIPVANFWRDYRLLASFDEPFYDPVYSKERIVSVGGTGLTKMLIYVKE